MECFRETAEGNPTNSEINIFNQVKALFDNVTREQTDIYVSFLNSRDPAERESLAKTIQALEEAVINQVAQEHNLSFDVIARIVCKVEYYLDLA